MARSSYIYIVLGFDNFTIAGAFTVKHEMESMIEGQENQFHVYRVKDGKLDFKITKLEFDKPEKSSKIISTQ